MNRTSRIKIVSLRGKQKVYLLCINSPRLWSFMFSFIFQSYSILTWYILLYIMIKINYLKFNPTSSNEEKAWWCSGHHRRPQFAYHVLARPESKFQITNQPSNFYTYKTTWLLPPPRLLAVQVWTFRGIRRVKQKKPACELWLNGIVLLNLLDFCSEERTHSPLCRWRQSRPRRPFTFSCTECAKYLFGRKKIYWW
jgi:hypothetical protein